MQFGRRDAGARIAYAQAIALDPDGDRTAGRRVAEGVVEQDQQQLAQALGIGVDHQVRDAWLETQRHATLGSLGRMSAMPSSASSSRKKSRRASTSEAALARISSRRSATNPARRSALRRIAGKASGPPASAWASTTATGVRSSCDASAMKRRWCSSATASARTHSSPTRPTAQAFSTARCWRPGGTIFGNEAPFFEYQDQWSTEGSINGLGGAQTLRGFKANRYLGRTVAFGNPKCAIASRRSTGWGRT